MISATELRGGKVFQYQGEIFEVLEYSHIKMGRGSANVKVKVKNLKTGSTLEKSFISEAKFDEVEVEKKKLQYLYNDTKSFTFMDPKTYEQFSIPAEVVGDGKVFLKDGEVYEVLVHEDEALSLALPKVVEFEVTDTGPGVRGDSVSNVYKKATLETDVVIDVPLFINQGERIRVNTETKEYVSKVSK